MDTQTRVNGPINCACLIHGDGYEWQYVEKLYSMLSRHLTQGVQLHVYTEAHRHVPTHMIKHELVDLGVSGPRKSWWYKLQLFNSEYYSGPLLYFDLDVVITDNIDWITIQTPDYLWAPRDFTRLWNPKQTEINSSVMWWDTNKFHDVWLKFLDEDFSLLQRKFHGDQDFISHILTHDRRRFLDENLIRSWKWECVDGGYDFGRRVNKIPGSGTKLNGTSVLVFHGRPNPHEIQDPIVLQHWQ